MLALRETHMSYKTGYKNMWVEMKTYSQVRKGSSPGTSGIISLKSMFIFSQIYFLQSFFYIHQIFKPYGSVDRDTSIPINRGNYIRVPASQTLIIYLFPLLISLE